MMYYLTNNHKNIFFFLALLFLTTGALGGLGCDEQIEAGQSCDPDSESQCVDRGGRKIGLVCADGVWIEVEDGPCMPEWVPEDECYSPYSNVDLTYDLTILGCTCQKEDYATCVGYEKDDGQIHNVALICEDGSWLSVEDGPCEPQVCYGPNLNWVRLLWNDGFHSSLHDFQPRIA